MLMPSPEITVLVSRALMIWVTGMAASTVEAERLTPTALTWRLLVTAPSPADDAVATPDCGTKSAVFGTEVGFVVGGSPGTLIVPETDTLMPRAFTAPETAIVALLNAVLT